MDIGSAYLLSRCRAIPSISIVRQKQPTEPRTLVHSSRSWSAPTGSTGCRRGTVSRTLPNGGQESPRPRRNPLVPGTIHDLLFEKLDVSAVVLILVELRGYVQILSSRGVALVIFSAPCGSYTVFELDGDSKLRMQRYAATRHPLLAAYICV
jgi:hypothetical protein